MIEPKTARRTALAVIVVLLALFGITTTTWVGGKARDLEDRIEDLEASLREWTNQTGERLPVRGDGVPGNAWEDYRETLNRIRDLFPIKQARKGEPVPAPPEHILALANGIRAGAPRTRMQIHDPKDLQIAGSISAWVSVADVAEWCVRFELQEGRPLRAVDRILDAMWFGADLLRAGSFGGQQILQRSFQCAGDVIVADPTSAAERMLPALERLHDSLPGVEGELLRSEIWVARWVLKGDFSDFLRRDAHLLEKWSSSWREPVYLVDTENLLDDYERLLATTSAPWLDARAKIQKIRTRGSLSSLLGIGFWDVPSGLPTSHRRVLTMLRLLLAACREPMTLDPDPFADGSHPLHFRRQADRLIFWSHGPDGVDNGGQASVDATGFVERARGRSPDLMLVLPLHR